MLTQIFDIARQAGAPTAVGELRHIAVRDYAEPCRSRKRSNLGITEARSICHPGQRQPCVTSECSTYAVRVLASSLVRGCKHPTGVAKPGELFREAEGPRTTDRVFRRKVVSEDQDEMLGHRSLKRSSSDPA
jgi:hypothetical protein